MPRTTREEQKINSWTDRVRLRAQADAKIFFDEFPGQNISGDWDAEAWDMVAWASRAERVLDGEAWPTYHDTLHTEVSRFNREEGKR